MKTGRRARRPDVTANGGIHAPRQAPAFRLYVAGASPNTNRAIENLRIACETTGHGTYDVKIIDVMREPQRALEDGILVAPTLVRTAPGPERRIIGDLRDHDAVIALLESPESDA